MKKTLIILWFLCFVAALSAQTDILDTRLDFNCKNKPLKEALDKLKKKTGLRLSYSDHVLTDKRVTINMKNRKVKDILTVLIRKEQLTYETAGQQVLILPKKTPPRTYQKFTISGTVKDNATGTLLPLANILIDGEKPRTTNKDGKIYLRLRPTDSLRMEFAYTGYQSEINTFHIHRDTAFSIRLKTDKELLPEVVVQGNQRKAIPAEEEASVTASDVAMLRSISEQTDIIKSIQLLPGIQSGNEGFSGLNVRGGSTDQNLILLDDAPIYNASHLAGVFSIFNEAVIGDIDLYKNEVPARYGGRLSSVLDISVREGSMSDYSVKGNIGLLTSGILLEGPLKRDKTSILLAFRRTWLDVFMKPLSRRWLNESFTIGDVKLASNGEAHYTFYDINAKISHRFSEKDRLTLSLYNGGDNFSFTDKTMTASTDTLSESERILSSLWGNFTASLKWRHIFQQKMELNTTASFTDFEFDYYDQYAFVNTTPSRLTGARLIQNYTSDIQDIALKTELKYAPHEQHRFRIGGQAIQHRFRPGINQETEEGIDDLEQIETAFENPLIKTYEFAGYLQSRHAFGPFRLRTGLRSGFFMSNKKLFTTFEPRIALNAIVNKKLTLRSTYTYTTQYLHLLTNSGIELPTDLWVPATENVRPEQSRQFVAGAIWSNEDYTFSTDIFYKKMNHLTAFRTEDAIILSGNDWADKIAFGKGWAYGNEWALLKKTGKTTGMLAYTLAWSYRQFEDINEGQAYPYKYDRRHDISIAMRHDLSERMALKWDWTYGSGNPFTRPVREAPIADAVFPSGSPATIYIYESKNNSRMPATHRLNIVAEWQGKNTENYKWTLDFGIYNVYNRKNPFFLYIGEKENTRENEYKQLSLFPVLPYLNYKFMF